MFDPYIELFHCRPWRLQPTYLNDFTNISFMHLFIGSTTSDCHSQLYIVSDVHSILVITYEIWPLLKHLVGAWCQVREQQLQE